MDLEELCPVIILLQPEQLPLVKGKCIEEHQLIHKPEVRHIEHHGLQRSLTACLKPTLACICSSAPPVMRSSCNHPITSTHQGQCREGRKHAWS